MLLPGHWLLATAGSGTLNSLDPLLRQDSTLTFLQVSEKTMCLMNQKSCFKHDNTKERKSMKGKKPKLLYKLYLGRNDYSMENL